MTQVLAIVQSARRETAPDPKSPDDFRTLHVEIAQTGAKVMLLPGQFRGPDHVRNHVAYVLTLKPQHSEQHVQRNLKAIRRTLQELGVEEDAIVAELRRIEAAVRAEIWRQVLLPDVAR